MQRNCLKTAWLAWGFVGFPVAGLLPLLLVGCRPASPSATAPDGSRLFTTYCADCHGPQGTNDRRGAVPQMRLSAAKSLSEQAFVRIIANGRGAMPALKSRLSTAEIEAVARYARSLARETAR